MVMKAPMADYKNDDGETPCQELSGSVLICKWNPRRKGSMLSVGYFIKQMGHFNLDRNCSIGLKQNTILRFHNLQICRARHLVVTPSPPGSHEAILTTSCNIILSIILIFLNC